MNSSEVRQVARGKWLEILPALTPALGPACLKVGRHGPCPVHGGTDGFRLFQDAAEKGGGICNSCGPRSDGFATLQWANDWTFPEALRAVGSYLGIQPKQTGNGRKRKSSKERLNATWKEATGDRERIVEYFRYRGMSGRVPAEFRLHPALPYFDPGQNGQPVHIGEFPAILAPIQSVNGKWLSIHRIYLDPNGPGKAAVSSPKKMMTPEEAGGTKGGAIRIGKAGAKLVLTEGVETAIAISEATSLPAWSCISAGGLEAIRLPATVEEVYIGADNDSENSNRGQQAAEKLAARLHADGLIVHILIPSKSGDWLDVLNTDGPTTLKKAVEESNPWEPPKGMPLEAAGPYCISNGAIIWLKETRDGPVSTQLSNFVARIVGQEIRDDGAEQVAVLIIDGVLKNKKPLPRIAVPAERFPGMGWVTKWGMAPIIHAGQAIKDHLRAAIQMLSGEVPSRTVYGHLGWRKIGEYWTYLHTSGAIGPKGPILDVNVEPGDGNLRDFTFPDVPAEEDLQGAIQASMSLLDLASPATSFSVLAATYRAPLGEALPVDFSLFFSGPTGTQKTELSAMAQAHFGPGFHGKNLPGSWSSTANALEKLAFLAKDMVLVVDDFAPVGSNTDVQRMHREADRLLRARGTARGEAGCARTAPCAPSTTRED